MSRAALRVPLLVLVSLRVLASPAPELIFRSWVQGPDARNQWVRAILETRDGYLWMGTEKGLVRFDGVDFTAFNSTDVDGIKGDDISYYALWEDAGGSIWAGTFSHGVIVNDHGHFRTLQKAEGLPDLSVVRIDGDETGATWIYTETGVSRWSNGRLERMHPEWEGTGTSSSIRPSDRRTADFAKMGLWRRGPAGLERFAYGHWSPFPTPPGDTRRLEDVVRNIYEDRLHRVWYTTGWPRGRYFCVQNGQLQIFNGLPASSFVSYQDRSGFLWTTDHEGHAARWKYGNLYPVAELHTPYFLQMIERAGGTIWMASIGTPLVEYRPRRIRSIETSGIPEVGSVLFQQRSGDIWAGGTNLLHGEHDKNEIVLRPFVSNYDTRYVDPIYAISEDPKGHLLLGSRRFEGVEELRGNRLTPYLPAGWIRGRAHALLLASSGDQWVGTTKGLYRVSKERETAPIKLLSDRVFCLAEPKPGSIWVGTATGPVLFRDNQRQELRTPHLWSFGAVRAISFDREGDAWMATPQHGIVRYAEGRFDAVGSMDGLPTDDIFSVTAKDELLWLRTTGGLLRIPEKSVNRHLANRSLKLQVSLFAVADGLPSSIMQPVGNQGTLCLAGGVLWFTTLGGIAEVRPNTLTAQFAMPHPVIQEHVVDGSHPLPSGRIVLHPQNNLELRYTALGSARPEQVRFRYRLDGFDTDWIPARNRRVAYYTHLPPGRYSFHVQAADNDGDFEKALDAGTTIDVLTPFYQSWWMKTIIGCVAVLTVLFILEARRRIERAQRRLRQAFTHRLITTQEDERKRIAHELHDSLGQHLVLIRTLAMLPGAAPSTAAGNHLSKIAEQAAEAIHEVEAISYDLRPYQLDRLGLTKAMQSLIQDLETSQSLTVKCSLDNVDGFFSKDLEINFYRIVQEALSNILKHAQATQVAVRIIRTQTSVRMTISDDGRGFPAVANTQTSGGLGLIGMKERAEALGGHAFIESSAGAGTKILVEVRTTI